MSTVHNANILDLQLAAHTIRDYIVYTRARVKANYRNATLPPFFCDVYNGSVIIVTYLPVVPAYFTRTKEYNLIIRYTIKKELSAVVLYAGVIKQSTYHTCISRNTVIPNVHSLFLYF